MLGKSRKWLLVLVLLLVVSMVAAACGGDDDKDDNGDNGDLTQSFTGANGVTVKYPEGWIARDGGNGVEIANSQDTLDAMDAQGGEIPEEAVGIMIMAAPLDQMGMAGQSVKDVMGVLAQSMGSEGDDTEVGEVTDTKVAGQDAARVTIKDSSTKSEGFFVGYMVDDNTLVIVTAAAREGELDKYEDTALKIAESVTYSAPAADATEAPAG
jgi:hypothetical protein